MSKLIFKKCKIECVSAKSTRKYYTFSTPNNLKSKRSFELSSCSKKTKKLIKMRAFWSYFAGETVAIFIPSNHFHHHPTQNQ